MYNSKFFSQASIICDSRQIYDFVIVRNGQRLITGSADSELRVWDIEYIDSLVSLCCRFKGVIIMWFEIFNFIILSYNLLFWHHMLFAVWIQFNSNFKVFKENACPRTVKLHRVYNHYLETGRRCRACFKKNEDGKWRGRWRWGRGGWRSGKWLLFCVEGQHIDLCPELCL